MLLDTNFLLRYIIRDVESQFELVKRVFTESNDMEITVSSFIVPETVYVMEKVYQLSRHEIHESLQLLKHDVFDVEDGANIFQALDYYIFLKKLSFADCYLLAKHMNTPGKSEVLTFDKDLLREANEHQKFFT